MSERFYTLLLHLSVAVILTGAIVTHFGRQEGKVRLDPGITASQWVMEDGTVKELPELMTLQKFQIELYPDSEDHKDYKSDIKVGLGNDAYPMSISMNKIGKIKGYRFYQSGYDGASTILMVVRDPWGVGITYAGYILFLTGFIGLLLKRKYDRRIRLTLLIAFLLACVSVLIMFWPGSHMFPVLRSLLLPVHVLPILMSYLLFGFVAFNGIRGLARKDSAGRLMDFSLQLLFPSVFLIAFGTIIGSVWANISWGSYWSWDPKETWALVTTLVYAAALHGQHINVFRNTRFFHIYSIAAFACVLITFLGVSLLMGGMHSYL